MNKYYAVIWLVLIPIFAGAQNPLQLRVLDIANETPLTDFTLVIIQKKDTTQLTITDQITSLPIIKKGNYELILRKAGFREQSTSQWECDNDSSTVFADFRMVREDAGFWEILRGRRHSRKMGERCPLKGPVRQGGFSRVPVGFRNQYTTLVTILYSDNSYGHWVAERSFQRKTESER